jgi:hypothetical protein
MFLPYITEVRLVGVMDRGQPNRERVLIQPLVATNLQNFVLGIGLTNDNVSITPLSGFIYYFDNVIVEPGSWVVVYTGAGTTQISRIPTTHEIAYSYHWGNSTILFEHPNVVPVLFRVSEMGFADALQAALPSAATPTQPQLGGRGS